MSTQRDDESSELSASQEMPENADKEKLPKEKKAKGQGKAAKGKGAKEKIAPEAKAKGKAAAKKKAGPKAQPKKKAKLGEEENVPPTQVITSGIGVAALVIGDGTATSSAETHVSVYSRR